MPEVLEVIPETTKGTVLPAYESDDGALKAGQIQALRRDAVQYLPNGELMSR